MSARANAVCRYVLANGQALPNGQFSIAIDSTELAKLLVEWQSGEEPVTPIERAIGVLAALNAKDFDDAAVEDLAVLQYWLHTAAGTAFVKSIGRLAIEVGKIDGHAFRKLGRTGR